MAQPESYGDSPYFQPRDDAESAGSNDPDAVGTNAIRALLLGLMLSNAQEALFGLEEPLAAVGLARDVRAITGWDDRVRSVQRAEFLLSDAGIPLGIDVRPDRPSGDYSEVRRNLWRLARISPQDPSTSVAWLISVMQSAPNRVDGVAAAAALSHWRRPRATTEVPVSLTDAREVLSRAALGADPVAQEVALAARHDRLGSQRYLPDEEPEPLLMPEDVEQTKFSVAIHGTFGWSENWWYRGGDFHAHIVGSIRRNLYSGGAPFSWSGGYWRPSRQQAAQRLIEWAAAMSAGQLDTAFAHSYGGEVALRSTTGAVTYDRLVLLSVPVHNDYDIAWRSIGRAQSLRLKFDLVLAAARARQRFGPNVQENILDLYPWRHSATHDPELWTKRSIHTLLGL